MTRIFYSILFLLCFFSVQVSAIYFTDEELENDVEIRQWVEGYTTTEEPIHWDVEITPQFLILHGEVATPIRYGYEYKVKNKDYGSYRISKGTVESTTLTPLVVYTHPTNTTFNKRPTLFVSFSGAFQESIESWQISDVDASGGVVDTNAFDLQARLESELGGVLQYKHILADWDDTRPMDGQIEQLADVIQMLLKGKSTAWNVVLVGHSRGGVLAHEVSLRLASMPNMANLYLILLDPTAAIAQGDSFPRAIVQRIGASGFNILGFNFYDGDGWTDVFGVPISAGTDSDRNVSGYLNLLINHLGHDQFPSEWLSSNGDAYFKLSYLLQLLTSNVNSGAFPAEGESGVYIAKSRARPVHIAGSFDFTGDEFTAEFVVNTEYLSSSFEGSLGEDGASVTANMIMATAYASLKEDRLEYSTSDSSSRAYGSFTKSGFDTHMELLGVYKSNTSVNINGNASVSIQVLNEEVSVDANLDYIQNLGKFVFGGNGGDIPVDKFIEKVVSSGGGIVDSIADFFGF